MTLTLTPDALDTPLTDRTAADRGTTAPVAGSTWAPTLRLERFFSGRTTGCGLFQDLFGTVRRQFTVTIDGRWDGKALHLDEAFLYDDGATERRRWSIEPVGHSGYVGRAEGVLGRAAGTVVGNGFHWRYGFALLIGGRTLAVHFDDRMVLQPDGALINRALVRKWGLPLGSATIVFRRA